MPILLNFWVEYHVHFLVLCNSVLIQAKILSVPLCINHWKWNFIRNWWKFSENIEKKQLLLCISFVLNHEKKHFLGFSIFSAFFLKWKHLYEYSVNYFSRSSFWKGLGSIVSWNYIPGSHLPHGHQQKWTPPIMWLL